MTEIYIHSILFMHPEYFLCGLLKKTLLTELTQIRVYTTQSGGGWPVNGQYAHFMLSWSTQQTMPVGCGQMRWQSHMDRRGKEAEHLHSVNIYTDPIGNLIHTILRFAHTVNRHVLPNQTTKIQPAQATLNP